MIYLIPFGILRVVVVHHQLVPLSIQYVCVYVCLGSNGPEHRTAPDAISKNRQSIEPHTNGTGHNFTNRAVCSFIDGASAGFVSLASIYLHVKFRTPQNRRRRMDSYLIRMFALWWVLGMCNTFGWLAGSLCILITMCAARICLVAVPHSLRHKHIIKHTRAGDC